MKKNSYTIYTREAIRSSSIYITQEEDVRNLSCLVLTSQWLTPPPSNPFVPLFISPFALARCLAGRVERNKKKRQ
jgi:hypothetical protein